MRVPDLADTEDAPVGGLPGQLGAGGALAAVSQWGHSFARLWAVVRSALWLRLDLRALLQSYGTAGGSFRMLGAPEQAYLPGLG